MSTHRLTPGSKFSGIKQFTLYEIATNVRCTAAIPVLSAAQISSDVVAHRFKHFSWLHDRLIQLFPCVMVPPIPDKQIQGQSSAVIDIAAPSRAGRFDDVFIEQRRRSLERFLGRAARAARPRAAAATRAVSQAAREEGAEVARSPTCTSL